VALPRAFTVLGLLLIGFCLVGFRPPALVGSDDPETGLAPWVVTPDAFAHAKVPPVPTIQATAAAVVDDRTGLLVWGKNPHQALPPASMTKMMTALVAIQRGKLDQVVTSTVDAKTMVGDSVMGLHPGERLSLRDLLYGLLVPSGDDAALAIARAVGGSDAAFVTQMNQEADNLGLTDTRFVNPHGLDAPGHLASPYDMIAIARVAMRDPTFRQIVATRQITIRGTWTYDLTNTNSFLGRRPEVIGVKTGTTDAALHCITVAADVGSHLLYVTVMHTPDYLPDVTALLDYFETREDSVSLAPPETSLAVPSAGGTPRHLALAADAGAYLPRWQAETLTSQVDTTPDAALRATDSPDLPPANAGAVTVYAAGEPIARLPLVAK
jgi:serine-type D-Ala-D-Ala carboxypeptidase (penicillin-binding protein 5/6)